MTHLMDKRNIMLFKSKNYENEGVQSHLLVKTCLYVCVCPHHIITAFGMPLKARWPFSKEESNLKDSHYIIIACICRQAAELRDNPGLKNHTTYSRRGQEEEGGKEDEDELF